jgi:hypothetical protein
MAIAGADPRLYGTEGFVVESPEGDVGLVEDVWVGEKNEPRALAVRTADGRHGLLLGDEILAVDRENHWVVVASDSPLLELDVPHLMTAEGGGDGTRLAASWITTGEVFHASTRRRRAWRLPLHLPKLRTKAGEPLLWQAVALLLGSIAVLVAIVIAVAYLIAQLVTGSPY